KSTVARLLAHHLGYTYIDSGAMYRALAWAARRDGLTGDDPESVLQLLQRADIDLRLQPDGTNRLLVDGRDITDDLRSPEIGRLASKLSALPPVRRKMVALQQDMARDGRVVMEG
ncbi:MAG: cytidylate kinase, partial [Gemmatimonadetes bacterium]|nr:cytidylate kinase [Gemmatimonadota bacterium]